MHDALPAALILLVSAVAVVVLFRRMSMPAILGYLIACKAAHHAPSSLGDLLPMFGVAIVVAAIARFALTSVLEARLDHHQREMFAGPWVMGKEFSICDGYLFTLTQWLDGDGVDVTRTPKIADHFKRMSARPAVRKAVEQETAPLQSAA